MSNDPKDEPRNPIDDFLDSLDDDVDKDPLDSEVARTLVNDVDAGGDAQVLAQTLESGEAEGSTQDHEHESNDNQGPEVDTPAAASFNSNVTEAVTEPAVDHEGGIVAPAMPQGPGDQFRVAAHSAKNALSKAAGLVADKSAAFSGLVARARRARQVERQEPIATKPSTGDSDTESPSGPQRMGSTKAKPHRRNAAFVVSAVLILAVAGIKRCSEAVPPPPNAETLSSPDLKPVPEQSVEDNGIELPPLEPQRDDSLDLLPEVTAATDMGDPHQYQSIAFGPLGASARAEGAEGAEGAAQSESRSSEVTPDQPAQDSDDQIGEAGLTTAAPEASPAPTAAPSPPPKEKPQTKTAIPGKAVTPTPGVRRPRDATNVKPDIRIGAIVAASGCWNCAPSVLVLHEAGRDVVAAGDQWKGYTVSVFGDRVTLSSKTGSWSFLPER